jgi:hypothetical protein
MITMQQLLQLLKHVAAHLLQRLQKHQKLKF